MLISNLINENNFIRLSLSNFKAISSQSMKENLPSHSNLIEKYEFRNGLRTFLAKNTKILMLLKVFISSKSEFRQDD